MKKIKLLALLLVSVLSINLWAEKITTVAGITSGNKYYIGATTSSTDYYFYVDGKSTTTSIKGAAKTDVAEAVALTFTAVTGGWTIQFDGGNYLGLNDSKDNGAVQVVADAVVWTIEEDADKNLLKLHPNNSYSLQKNNSGTQFGSYGNTQTNVWLEAVGGADPVTTLYLSEAGTLSDNLNGTYNVGDKYTLPEETDAECGGKTFVGWSTKEITTPITEPKPDFYEPGEEVTLAADNTFYAVFADASGNGQITYTKLSNNSFDTEASYVLVAEESSSNSTLHYFSSYTGTTANESWGVTSTKASDAIEFTLSGTADALVAKDASGNYLQALATGKFRMSSSSTTLTYKNDGTIYNPTSGSTGYNLRYNHNNGSGGFRWYNGTTGTSAYFYKKSGGTSYSNYTTTCAPVYEAIVASGITNGSVVISKTDDAATGTTSLTGLKQGDKVYIFPTANTGYKLDAVTVNETPISATEGKYIYTIGEAGITVSATFAPATYQITYNLDGGAWNGAAGVATYTYGTGVPTLPTNVEKANNTFLGWYVTNPAEIVTSIGATETGDKSFIASWLPSGARDVAYSGDEQLNYTSNPQIVDKDDASLTVTYSVNKGYTISAVAVTVDGSALTADEVVFNDEQLTITPTAGFTGNVSITFTVVEKMFSVTWMANKAKFKEEQIQEGSKVILPTGTPDDVEVSADDTYKFQGWFTEEQYSSDDTPPSYITNNTIEPTGDVTYYAVYAIKEPGVVANSYVKGAKTDLTEGQKVIIVNGNSKKALSSENLSSTQTTYRKAIGVTITNNKISNTNANIVWTVSLENSKYIFKQGTNYLNSTGNNLYCNGNKDTWTITAVSGNAGYTLLSTGGSKYLEYYSDYTEFTCYTGSGNAFNMDFYIPEVTETTKNYRTRVAVIDHIAVNGTPAETKFVAGETFDATGLSIDVYYKDEDTPTNVTEGFTYAPTTALATTDNKVTFTYQGKTADVNISVSNTVSGIEVTNNPDKMEYTEGQQFNPEGMEVTATYDNTAKRVVTGYDYEPKGDLALDDKITISFGEKTTDLSITINEATKTTVNWFVEGNAYTVGNPSTAVIPGKKITALPTEPNACQGNQFVGWTAVDANYYNATTAPTDLFKTLAAVPTIGETETNFYAVFAEVTSTPVAESTVYTSNISEITGKKVKIADTEYDALQFGTGKAPQDAHNITVPAGTTTLTLHAASWNNSSDVTLTASTEVVGVTITPSTAVSVVANTGLTSNSPWTITPDNENEFFTFTLSGVKEATSIKFENNNAERVVIWGVNASTTITSDYSTTCLAALAAPTITTDEGTYCGSVDVEITQPVGNPEGAQIMYSTDNETWQEYTAAVNLTTSGTIYAKVVKDPKQTDVVSATYTVYPRYTLATASALETEATGCLTFSNLLVNGKSSNMLFTEDADGNVYTFSYKGACDIARGDKIEATDAHLTFSKVNGVLNFASVDDVTTMSQNNPTKPSEATAITAINAGYYAHVVKLANVTMHVVDATAKNYTLIDGDGNEIAVANTFIPTLPTWLEGAKYDVYGIIVLDGEGNPMIAPRNNKGANEDGDMISLAEKLDAPEDLVVSDITSCGASFAWGEVTNASKYSVYIYDKDEKEVAKSENRTTRTYTPNTKFEANSTYTWKVKAIGDNISYTESDYAQGTFTTNPNAKLNWYVGGSLYQTTDASQEKVETPEDPESPCATNYENFVTWYTEEIVSETGQITALEASKKVKAGDAAASATTEQVYNFYAVFGKVKTPGTDKYVKVTEAQDDWKGEYLIGYDEGDDKDALTVFDGSLTTLDAANNNQTVSFESDGSVKATEIINGYRFTFTKSATTKDGEGNDAVYYNIQSASGYYIGGASGKDNGLLSSTTTKYDNEVNWDATYNQGIEILNNRYLCFNDNSSQMRFRYMSTDAGNLVLYKRITTNPQYSGYITTCPVTYTITIANNTKGLVEAATTTEILKGASVKLTATANAGYTKTGGNWIVKNTTTGDVVDGLVGATNYLTMPDYGVTIDYNFQEIKDQFVDNLHGNSTIEKGGANYELPTLSDFSETTGKPSDAFTKFIGWSATSYDSGEPATEKPAILEGSQTATGATYFAVWYNSSGKYITEYCQTAVPTNLHLVEEYHKATSVRIDWDNVTGADKYHIIVMDGEANIIADADVTESLYDLSGLTPGATYICTVKAHKDCWSDETELEFETKENIQSYTVTINAEGGTYTIDPELVEGKIQEGATVTITDIAPTDADHYFFKELTVPEATDLIEITGGYTFTMPGKAVTINIVFAEYPTITWKMEGAADQTSIAVRNDDKFEVGTIKSAPADWKYKTYFPEFAGWVTSDKCDAEGNVTTAKFITATTEVPATGLTVYGAVAKKASADLTQTTKVVADANIEADAIYVIGAAQSSSEETMYYLYAVDGEKNWGRMTTADDETNTPMLLTAESVDGGFTLKNAAGLYIQGTTTKSKFPAMTTTAAALTLSTTATDESAIHHIYNSSTFYMRHNYNSTTQGIRWYDGTSTGTPAYLYKVALAYEKLTINPQPDYGRTDLVVGNYGTVCVPYAVKATDRSGATFWNIETSNAIGSTNPTSVTIVEETEDLVAGKPYIFCATETEMALFFSGEEYKLEEHNNATVQANGLYGNLTDATITINEKENPQPTDEPTRGYFFVLQQKLYECGWNCTVGPNRGWVQADQIGSEPVEAPVSAPRRVIGNPNGTPTGINNLNTDGWKNIQGARKYFHNNHIVIVNEGRIYNAQGIEVQ